jgi:hypothetical protein
MADIYGNVSAAGGFDQSEIEFVTNLINSGQVSVADVAKQFGLPESIISAAYEANRPAVEPATIERLNHHQTAPGSLSPAATTTISSPFLPDATYNIPGFSLPDYRYNDTSGSTGGLSSTSGGLTNYVTAVEPARSGPEGYTGPSINALPPGGGLGPNESSLGNTTLDRGIGGGASFVDGDSSIFHQDLIHQDAKEEARDVDFLDYLARLAAQEANKPLGGTQGAYDAILEASAAIDTGGEYADELYRLNSAIDNKTKEGFGYAKQAAYGVDSLGNELTPAQIAAAERAATAALDTKNTLVDERNTLFKSGVEAGIIETPGFLESLKDTGLEGLSNVLGAGTRGIYNVASNIPVVGGYLGDSIGGVADWLKNMEGVVSYNPITGAVQGTWGDLPPWMEKQTVTQIGTIPGSQTKAGVTTGTIFDDFISIGRGEQDIEDVLKDRTEQVASTIGIDPKILAAATAAGMSIKDYLEAQKPKQTTLAPETDTTTEKETTATIDLSSGPDSDVLNEVLGPQQGVETVTGEEAIDPTSTNQTLTLGDGTSPIETVLSGDTVENVLDGEDIEDIVDTLTLGGDSSATTDLDFVFEGPLTADEEPPEPPEEPPEPPEEPPEPPEEPPEPPEEPPEPPEEPPEPPEEPPEPPEEPPEPPEEPPEPPEEPPEPPEEPPEPPEEPPEPPEEPPEPPEEPPEPPEEPPEPPEEPPEPPEEPPEPPEEPPEPPLDLSGLFGLRTKPGEKVGDLDFYDISGESIFQSRDEEEEEDPLAFLYSNLGDSGIVQDYDIEELIRYLAETRG